jgi:hypothetical protein
MSLADTGKAIGAVTKSLQGFLRTYLLTLPILTAGTDSVGPVSEVSVGRPEPPDNNGPQNPRLNLFLYEIQLDPSLRNVTLDEGQPPPLWLVLKYLLTAFDDGGESDSVAAQLLLGEGMRALQQLAYMPASTVASILGALQGNPEILKITFDQTPSDLLAKLMQGADEKYRCSIGFEIRPVMIATGELPSYSLLVGVDYTTNTVHTDPERGVQINVLPSMGPQLNTIAPTTVEPSGTLILQGNDLQLSNLSVNFGPVALPITVQSPVELQCSLTPLSDGSQISAGSQGVAVVQTLPSGRKRSSNLLVGNLLPTLTTANVDNPTPAEVAQNVVRAINLQGLLLGNDQDDAVVALYQNGQTVQLYDELVALAGPPQTQRRLLIRANQVVPAGTYLLILRVNGQQAKSSPTVVMP